MFLCSIAEPHCFHELKLGDNLQFQPETLHWFHIKKIPHYFLLLFMFFHYYDKDANGVILFLTNHCGLCFVWQSFMVVMMMMSLSNRNETDDAWERLQTRWRLKLISVQTCRTSDLFRWSLLQTRRGICSKPCRESRRYICRRHTWQKVIVAPGRLERSAYQIKIWNDVQQFQVCSFPCHSLPHTLSSLTVTFSHTLSLPPTQIFLENKRRERIEWDKNRRAG